MTSMHIKGVLVQKSFRHGWDMKKASRVKMYMWLLKRNKAAASGVSIAKVSPDSAYAEKLWARPPV